MLIIRWPKKDSFNRSHFCVTELNKLVLRGLLSNCGSFSFLERAFFYKSFCRYFFKFSISFFRNSCLFTGHAKSIFRLFKLCRHGAKASASAGFLLGMRKSSF